MPIKFRCVHCRQLLGISRGKAGQPVDCPTCGRTVRVPNLDGKAEPVSAPGMNLNDSSLRQALDALALIGQISPDEASVDDEFAEAVVAQNEAPPAPQAIEIAAPLPAQIVLPKVVPAEEKVGRLEGDLSWVVASPAGVLNEVAERAASRRSALTAVLVGMTALSVGTLGGFFLGRSSTAGRPIEISPGVSTSEAPASPPATAESKAAMRGRITYRTDTGESRPDTGARVIVLPIRREGEVRLPIAGFRAADSDADFQVARAAVRALGGDVARVGEDGSYEILLTNAGQYHVLVLSRFQPQTTERPTDAGLKSILESWFARPDQLLGQVRHQLGQTRYSGEAPQLWDHSFEPAA